MKALILVDLQNDFLPGGALAVPRGEEVIAVANRLMPQYDLVVATQDWHPPDHWSFASQHHGHSPGEVKEVAGLSQVLWPDHCVQGEQGAELADDLDQSGIHRFIRKGADRQIDSYSGFFDNGHGNSTGLADFLQEHGVTQVDVMGLATDYCVKFTAMHAAELGFKTRVITEGSRGVELTPGDCEKAIAEMRKCGITVV